MKILFLTLKTFSSNGGIEKVCRFAGMAMNEYCKESNGEFTMYSMHDEKKIKTEPYLSYNSFIGFSGMRWWFIIKSFQKGIRSGVVVLGHINLLFAGYLVKLFSPKTKVILIAHNPDGGGLLSSNTKRFMKRLDLIIVSGEIAKDKLKTVLNLPSEKFKVLNNCLDPFLPMFADDELRRNECRSSYSIAENDFVVMTLSTLSSKKRNRGYDKVLIAVKKLHGSFPNLKYLFVGKYEAEEKLRLNDVIHDLGIEDHVIFTGFVPDSVVGDFYNMSDIFIIPGEQEGFGFRYMEALYYNKPVITGRSNNTSDGLYGSRLGTRIDFNGKDEIAAAIQQMILNLNAFMPDARLVMEKFSFPVYKKNVSNILNTLVA